MTKQELITKIAEKMTTEDVRVTKKAATEFLETFVAIVTDALVEGDNVKIAGFGNFDVAERAAREARNPQNGDRVMIDAHKVPKFKFAKAVKDAVK